MTKSRGILPPRTFWTESQIAQLTKLYPDAKTETIAKMMGVSTSRIYAKAASLGLKKSESYLASPDACRLRRGGNVGSETRFKSGNESWNKGKPHPSTGRTAETQFKKGSRNGNAVDLWKPIGSERISKDGYIERKINDDMPLQKRWRAAHILAWEAANGALPKGFAIVFKDGNKQNITLDNLECISRADLMRRNTYHNYPKPIAELVQLRGALTRQINRRERNAA